MEKPSLEEIKHLVSFKRDRWGHWVIDDVYVDVCGSVCHVKGHVYGDVKGDVKGDVCGYVYGDVKNDVYGDVKGNVCGHVYGDVFGDVKKMKTKQRRNNDMKDIMIPYGTDFGKLYVDEELIRILQKKVCQEEPIDGLHKKALDAILSAICTGILSANVDGFTSSDVEITHGMKGAKNERA